MLSKNVLKYLLFHSQFRFQGIWLYFLYKTVNIRTILLQNCEQEVDVDTFQQVKHTCGLTGSSPEVDKILTHVKSTSCKITAILPTSSVLFGLTIVENGKNYV